MNDTLHLHCLYHSLETKTQNVVSAVSTLEQSTILHYLAEIFQTFKATEIQNNSIK